MDAKTIEIKLNAGELITLDADSLHVYVLRRTIHSSLWQTGNVHGLTHFREKLMASLVLTLQNFG